MNNTLTLLLNVKNKQPVDSINYKIADYLLNHLGQLHHMTTSFLASECHVSKSAISRFCRSIGLEDFLDLQIMARSPLQDPQEKFYIDSNMDTDEFYINKVKDYLSYLKQIDIGELVEDLHNYENIYLMGHMQSSLPAYNLQYDFAHLGKQIICVDDIVRQKEILQQSHDKDLIIVFSVSGHFFKNSFIRDLKSVSSKIYLISAAPHIKQSNVYKTIYTGMDNGYTNVINMMVLTQLIVLHYNQKYMPVS